MAAVAVALLVGLRPSVASPQGERAAGTDEDPAGARECTVADAFGIGLTIWVLEVYRVYTRSLGIVFPHPGIAFGLVETPSLQLSWPGTIPFGPVAAETAIEFRCAKKPLRFKHRPNRFVVEPGLDLPEPVRLYGRVGYRFVHHAESSRLGFGAGIGSTVMTDLNWNVGPSVSPEILIHAGECCLPGYVLVTLRYDHFFGIEPADVVSYSIGFDHF